MRLRKKLVAALTVPVVGVTGSSTPPAPMTGLNGSHPAVVFEDASGFERSCQLTIGGRPVLLPAPPGLPSSATTSPLSPPVVAPAPVQAPTEGFIPPPSTPAPLSGPASDEERDAAARFERESSGTTPQDVAPLQGASPVPGEHGSANAAESAAERGPAPSTVAAAPPGAPTPGGATCGPPPPPALAPVRTEIVGQLTGASPNPLRDKGMLGTDLGVSGVTRDGRVWVLFGDSITGAKDFTDSAAFVAAPYTQGEVPRLSWQREPMRNGYLPLEVRGADIDHGEMNVPVEAVEVGDQTYVFFSHGWDPATRRYSSSVLAHANGWDLSHLQLDHVAPTRKFVNVSVVREGEYLWIYGSGDYRRSAVYLARVKPEDLPHRDRWEYFAGNVEGSPSFVGGDEARALPLVDERCVGELSVRFNPTMNAYLMTYACENPRKVVLRYSANPTGPWSEDIPIFVPDRDGYGRIMHVPVSVAGRDDGLADSEHRRDEWGGEYAPYLFQPGFRDLGNGQYAVEFILSTWNPYQTFLVRTVLGPPA